MDRRAVGLVVAVWLAGCGGGDGDPDAAGTEDGGARRDAGGLDAGDEMDASGSSDGGAPDTGAPDTGAPDAGPPDAGPPGDAGPPSARQLARELGYMGSPQGFYEYLPPSYSPTGTGAPLLLFLHGLGENGDGMLPQLEDVLDIGPPRLIERDEWPAARPFVVLSPQQASSCPNASTVAAFLAWARDHYNLDDDRLYISGVSCGAIGTANYLRAHLDTTDVAAVVLISGNMAPLWEQEGCDLGRLAVWGIHGDADANGGTPPDSTRVSMEGLIACPSPPRRDARLDMLEGVGHTGEAWNDTYSMANGLDIYTWLLDNHR